MFNFFKRSKSRIDQQQQVNACASNSNRKKSYDDQTPQPFQQFENVTIDGRASSSNPSTKNGFFDIMAKGRNRRNNYGKNKQSQQQQQQVKQQQPKIDHNKTIVLLSSKTEKHAKCEKPMPTDLNKCEKIDSTTTHQKCDAADFALKNNFKYENQKTKCSETAERDCVRNGRHSDKNSTPIQYGANRVADDENIAADFVKGIIFEKYKRPLSPIHIRPVEVKPQQQVYNQLVDEMGQQPTKVQCKNNPIYQPCNVPSLPPTPDTPINDGKDIFYQADDKITAQEPNTFPIENNFNIPLAVLSENFDNNNYNRDNEFNMCVDTVPTVVAGDQSYDPIVINNDANLSIIQDNLNNEYDSPDSGIDVINNVSDFAQVINKLKNETNSSNSGCESAFKNSVETLDNSNGDIEKNEYLDSFERKQINSVLNFGEPKTSDVQQQQKKKYHFDDTISLPDIVESTGNGVVIMGTPENGQTNGADISGIHNVDEDIIGIETRDLVNHEARYSAQLEEAEKQSFNLQSKANDLAYQIDELERNLTVKTWNVERLQAELQAAYKEGECVKKKLKLQEVEMENIRAKFTEKEEIMNGKYNELEIKHEELQEKLCQVQKLARALQLQLAEAQCDAADARKEKEKCLSDRAAEKAKHQAALDAAIVERKKIEVKWHKDFEQLRTVNADREEHLLQDCEWKLRTTEQKCKAKINAAETAKNEALQKAIDTETESQRQLNEVKHLKSHEAEVAQLRGLTSEQKDSINSMTEQLNDLKTELQDANKTIEESIVTIRKIKFQFEQEISDRDRHMIQKIDEARGEVAVMWEDRLMEEMGRLKIELESCYAEDRADALQKAQAEHLEEIAKLANNYNAKEKELKDEIAELKKVIADRNSKLKEAQERSDAQILQIRVILDKSEREHQREMDAEIHKHEEIVESLRLEYENDRQEMEEKFRERLQQVSEEFARELTNNQEELSARHKKQIEQQWEKLMVEKEESIQDLDRSYKRKLTDADTRLRDLEISHHRDIKDMKNAHAMERTSLERRDLQNSQEIETLHRKCRCLTKLFEEMRMRYERRDPRAEDLREIEELKNRVESQDRDLCKLTEKLRELQINQQQQGGSAPRKQKNKKAKLNCDVIYEENEDRESPPTNGYNVRSGAEGES